jgi:hypothetical protein
MCICTFVLSEQRHESPAVGHGPFAIAGRAAAASAARALPVPRGQQRRRRPRHLRLLLRVSPQTGTRPGPEKGNLVRVCGRKLTEARVCPIFRRWSRASNCTINTSSRLPWPSGKAPSRGSEKEKTSSCCSATCTRPTWTGGNLGMDMRCASCRTFRPSHQIFKCPCCPSQKFWLNGSLPLIPLGPSNYYFIYILLIH